MSITKYTRPRQLLAHILEEPGLVSTIQSLEPEVLSRLVHHVGLEDAGELVALATPQQLMAVFDEDLWHREGAGDAARFDAARFALWLEILLESGAKLAAQKVSELDEDLLTFALCQNVLVIDIEQLARAMSSGPMTDDSEQLQKELEGSLYQEFEQFRVIAKDARTWEPIRTLLVELDAEYSDLLLRLLERCCDISNQYIDDNGGLYDVLSSEAMLQDDVTGDREDRRNKKGYVAPSLARSFLAHARVESLDAILQTDAPDPATHAYFRDSAAPRVEGPGPATGGGAQQHEQVLHNGKLLAILRDAELIPHAPSLPLLGAGEPAAPGAPAMVISVAMRALRDESDALYSTRLNELAYLSNVLLAGGVYQSREFRPVEAAQAALSCANLGAERLLASQGKDLRDAEALAALLNHTTLVKLFRIGWHLYFGEIVAPAAQKMVELLERSAASTQAVTPAFRALTALKRELAAGKPWRAIPNLTRVMKSVSADDDRILRAAAQEFPLVFLKSDPDSDRSGMVRTGEQVEAFREYLKALGGQSRRTTAGFTRRIAKNSDGN